MQTAAARLLAHSHPEVATKSLCAALNELCKELDKDRDAYKAYWQNQKRSGVEVGETANDAMKQLVGDVEQERIRALDEREAYLAVLCESLGRFRDDRSVDALARVLARPLRTRSRAAVESLLSLASRDAVKSVVDALAGCEEVRKELGKEGDGSAVSTDLREWSSFVDERLRAFAKARELEHPQAKAEVPYAEWRTWSVKALAGLPKSLGRVPVVPSARK